MANLWNYFNSPELVYQVQHFFGIEKVDSKKNDNSNQKYIVKNKFFYYLFLIGTELGDELFYGIFIPFCIHNCDNFLARRFVFVWFVLMYVGQALKEFFIEVRPQSPAIQMQKKWSNEYSLPSTHAMSSPAIAVTIVYFALERYEANLLLCTILTVIWISVVSWSRVYLGMHSVLDLLMGFALSAILLIFLLPITNSIELFLATSVFGPVVLLLITIPLMVYFPRPKTNLWTPTKGDTISIAGVFVGVEIGHWLNYQMGYLNDSDVTLPLSLDFSNLIALGLRTVICLAIAGGSEFIGKIISYSLLCFYFNEDGKALKNAPNTVDNRRKNFIDLSTKFLTYFLLGFNTLFVTPLIFKYFNIQRNSFYTEI
ncbi:hypothetical protein PVAND_005084 [Polypedilum vanderplanki]|uniref:Phosphatidic acid phosphatase type 2/haloperoxidase domain-containing protein n=1 Tax=Polypedilum vanderplanki TaxID=319348 RepID=A0A9J6C0Z5_POLVA|nr:hypothetical protein PVAND_005084 [Polypedilum vanderplanki]